MFLLFFSNRTTKKEIKISDEKKNWVALSVKPLAFFNARSPFSWNNPNLT